MVGGSLGVCGGASEDVGGGVVWWLVGVIVRMLGGGSLVVGGGNSEDVGGGVSEVEEGGKED